MQSVSIVMTNRIMLFNEVSSVCEQYATHKYSMWQNAEFINITAGGT
jgi:hypothetical protein